MRDELARLTGGEREPQAERHGIEPRLELAEQLLARDASLAAGPIVVDAHLPLADAVDRAELLLLEQPNLVLGYALTAAAVLPGRVGALVGRAVRPPAEGRADPAAHPMSWSDLVHAAGKRTKGARAPPHA